MRLSYKNLWKYIYPRRMWFSIQSSFPCLYTKEKNISRTWLYINLSFMRWKQTFWLWGIDGYIRTISCIESIERRIYYYTLPTLLLHGDNREFSGFGIVFRFSVFDIYLDVNLSKMILSESSDHISFFSILFISCGNGVNSKSFVLGTLVVDYINKVYSQYWYFSFHFY